MSRKLMKKARTLLLIALTMGMAAATGYSTPYCPSMITATSSDRSVIVCDYESEDDNYCYYNCNCIGNQSSCDDLYAQLGFDDV